MRLLHYISADSNNPAEYVVICEDEDASVPDNKRPGFKYAGSYDVQHNSGQDILPVGRELMTE